MIISGTLVGYDVLAVDFNSITGVIIRRWSDNSGTGDAHFNSITGVIISCQILLFVLPILHDFNSITGVIISIMSEQRKLFVTDISIPLLV